MRLFKAALFLVFAPCLAALVVVVAASTGAPPSPPATLLTGVRLLDPVAGRYRAVAGVLVDGDPLQKIDDLGRIRLVVRAGELLDRNALLEQAKRAIVAAFRRP